MSVRGAVGAVVGAVIGTAFGNPMLGAQIGYTIGSATEPLPNQTVEGPRLGDLTVQTSNYGAPLPIVYGTARIAGNLIWIQNDSLIERRVVTESGGKGGGGGKTETITYQYYGTFAVALCEGTIFGVRKIWADSELIYSVGDDASVSTIIASNKAAPGIRIYTGTATQQPDGDIVADRTNAPAYRNVAYIVFNTLALKGYGNRIPNITCEVVSAGSSTLTALPRFTMTTNAAAGFTSNVAHVSANNTIYFGKAHWDNNNLTDDWNPIVMYANGAVEPGPTATSPGNVFIHAVSDEPLVCWSDVFTSRIYFYEIAHDGQSVGNKATILFDYSPTATNTSIVKYGDYLFILKYDGSLYRHDYDSLHYTEGAIVQQAQVLIDDTTSTVQPATWFDYTIGDDVIYAMASDDTVMTYTLDGVLIKSYTATLTPTNTHWSHAPGAPTTRLTYVRDGVFLVISSHGPCWKVDTEQETQTYLGVLSDNQRNNGPEYQWYGWRNGIIYEVSAATTGSGTIPYYVPRHAADLITEGSTTLDNIVSDLCDRSGLNASEYDVTELTDTVRGFIHTRPAAIAADILHLQRSFNFDVVESDYKIKFIKRGGASVVTVDGDDLSAHEAGQQRTEELIEQRGVETELPVRVKVDFIDQAREYDVNEQYAERLITDSVHQETVSLPVVLTADEGAKVAETLLLDAWLSRNVYEFNLPWRFSYLDPGDVIDLDIDRGSYNLRLIEVDYGKPGLVKCRAVQESSSIYSPAAVGEQGGTVTEEITLVGDTRFKFLDLPILRGADNDPGFYFAATGVLGGWPGSILYRSTDSGLTYQQIDKAINPATIGYATDVLPDGPHTIIDDSSTVNVVLYADATLSSVTEAAMRSGSNLCAIGAHGTWEILKFQNATLESDGSYTLDTMIRGYRGTEWATGLHAAGDCFVLLTVDTVYRNNPGADFIGTEYTYKPVTSGETLIETPAVTFTNEGVGRTSYAPVNIKATRDASQNVTITWHRRSRFDGAWRDGVDVPLDEPAETYEVDIISQGSPDDVLRTISVTTNSASYTAAQQTTDFGSTQTAILVRVYQTNTVVGRGYKGEATV